MYQEPIIAEMSEYLHKDVHTIASRLNAMLPRSGENRWEEHIKPNQSYDQRE